MQVPVQLPPATGPQGAACPKCQAPRQDFAPHASCPQCGIIYDKYDPIKAAELEARRQALRNGKKPAPAPREKPAGFADSMISAWKDSQAERKRHQARPASFINHLRETSIYPTFRQLVGWVYFLLLFISILFWFGGVYAFFSGAGVARISALLSGVFMGLLFIVIAKVFREMALMMADLSDAAVRMAAAMDKD